MTITVTGTAMRDYKTRRYVEKVARSLEKYITKSDRVSARAEIELSQIDEPHGNKYRASVVLLVGKKELSASDSTLNILAALDIVRLKLVRQLQ